jgi:hypothetical protein
MKEKALKTPSESPALLTRHFGIWETPWDDAREGNLFVNSWQGAIVVARAGEGLEHIGRVFRYLKEIDPLSC